MQHEKRISQFVQFVARGMSSHKFNLHISVVCQAAHGLTPLPPLCHFRAKIAVVIGKIISPTAMASASFPVSCGINSSPSASRLP